MAPRSCPIRFPMKCKHCPFAPDERVRRCRYYRKQVISGVPWYWKADRRYTRTLGDWEAIRSMALAIERSTESERS